MRHSTAYNLVSDALRDEILSGAVKPGARLATEAALCRRFATSRITVRRALQILEEEMLIERRQGSGTFVADATARRIPLLSTDFFGSVRRHAPDLRRELLRRRWVEADEALAATLGVIPGQALLEAWRIDRLGRRPVAVDQVFLPRRFANRLEEHHLEELHFLAVWQRIERLQLSHCRQRIEAVTADDEMSHTLRIAVGSALLKETSVMFIGSTPAGMFTTHYRADVFQLGGTVRLGARRRLMEATA